MRLTIHRGAHQVGGICIEIACGETTIIIDAGLPLDHDNQQTVESVLPQPLFDDLQKGKKKVDAVLLSHAHMDHYGLINGFPAGTKFYCGEPTADLINITNRTQACPTVQEPITKFQPWREFKIGPFCIKPFLMDHSAFGANGFLISANGKSIFFTGDFRGHGRKSKLLQRLIEKPPKVDALLMEGTLIGERASEQTVSEAELEEKFLNEMADKSGIVLVTTSSQNIDRLVTIFRAAKRSGRMFIIDFYTAEILEILKKYANLPNAEWPRIRVCYPGPLAKRFEQLGLQKILSRHRANGIRWTRINEIRERAVMLVRPGFLPNIKRSINLEGAVWIYSMWHGYLDLSKPLKNMKNYLEDKGVKFCFMHTSGHATISDLKGLVEAMKPELLYRSIAFIPKSTKAILKM
jgi:ribonuclease J